MKTGEISLERLNDAVRRILRVKSNYGLFSKLEPSKRYLDFPLETIGSQRHRDLSRQAVRESLVLLKNNNQTLPLNPSLNFLVIGRGAKEISKAAGGWSFTWQGTGTTNKDFPGATSIYEGLELFVEKNNGTISYSKKGKFTKTPDIAILVIGEDPYAEYQGSINSLEFLNDDFEHLKVAKDLREKGVKVVYLFLSGRPMWVNRELNTSDAFVAAWLPGTEGHGIAEVLFGKTIEGEVTDFKGKLSFSWPKEADASSLNKNDSFYDPLFSYGYGLTSVSYTHLTLPTKA